MRKIAKLIKEAAKASKHYYSTIGPRQSKSDRDLWNYEMENRDRTIIEKKRYGQTQRTKFAGQKYKQNKKGE